MSKNGLIERTDITDANTRFCGYARGMFDNVPVQIASFLVSIMSTHISVTSVGLQICVSGWPVNIYIRPVWDTFGDWKMIY